MGAIPIVLRQFDEGGGGGPYGGGGYFDPGGGGYFNGGIGNTGPGYPPDYFPQNPENPGGFGQPGDNGQGNFLFDPGNNIQTIGGTPQGASTNLYLQQQSTQQQQQDVRNYIAQHYAGYGGNAMAVPYGQNWNYKINPQNMDDPANFYNYFNDPNATNAQNRAFSIPGYTNFQNQIGQGLSQWQNMTPGQINPYIGQQQNYVNSLSDAAAGKGPSVAQNVLKQGQEANLAQMMAASQSGAFSNNPALAQRNIMSQEGAANQQTAAQAATMGAQEQIAARQQLGTALGQGSQQYMATQGMQNQMIQYYLGQGMNLAEAQAASSQALQSMLAGQYQAANLQGNALAAAANMQQAAFGQQNLQGGIAAGGALLGGIAGGIF